MAAGRYRLERVLGRGGMAVVYLARDEELDRPVAVKLLSENLAGDEEVRRRFLREARLAARLAHPNVVRVYDAGEEDGRPYIVMEWLEGETVADLLRRRGGRLPPDEAVGIALQACAGLADAHAAGLVHRDVKPQNLLLRTDGTVKLADFGIARAADATQLTELGTVLGTLAYLAPEQAAGEEVTAAADVYSLGAVLYELVTGGPPFTYESLADLAYKQQEGIVAPLRELAPEAPRKLEDTVMRCLARNPAYRPDSAAALAEELGGDVAEAPTRPLERPAPTRVLPALAGSRSRRLWFAAAGVAAVAALVLGLVLARPGGDGGGQTSPPPAPRVAPLQRGATPAEEASNLTAWIRKHSR